MAAVKRCLTSYSVSHPTEPVFGLGHFPGHIPTFEKSANDAIQEGSTRVDSQGHISQPEFAMMNTPTGCQRFPHFHIIERLFQGLRDQDLVWGKAVRSSPTFFRSTWVFALPSDRHQEESCAKCRHRKSFYSRILRKLEGLTGSRLEC